MYNVNTNSHCAQQIVIINKVVVVKSVMQIVVIMFIRIEQWGMKRRMTIESFSSIINIIIFKYVSYAFNVL